MIQCDESDTGLVLRVALFQDGRPLAYACQALMTTECNYAQIEKELLAIVFTAEQFYH